MNKPLLLAMVLCGCGAARVALPAPAAERSWVPALPEPGALPEVAAPELPPVRDVTLSGGVHAQIVRIEGTPVVFAALVGRGTYAFGDDAVIEVDSLLEGALGGSVVQSSELSADEILARARVNERGLVMVQRTFVDELDGVLARYGRLIRGGGLRDARIERARAGLLEQARFAEGTRARAMYLTPSEELLSRLYGEGNPRLQRLRLRSSRIEAVTAAELRHRLSRLLIPSETTLIIAGDFDPDAVEAAVREAVGEVTVRELEPAHPRVAPTFPDPETRLRIHGTGENPNAAVELIEHGPPIDHEDYPAFRILSRLLGGMFSSRLNLRLREARGDTYGVMTNIFDRYDHTLLHIALVTPISSAGDAAITIVEELTRFSDASLIEEEELELARGVELAAVGSRLETSTGVGSALVRAFLASQSPESILDLHHALAGLDTETVAAVARRWLRPEKAPMVIVGEYRWLFAHSVHVPGGVDFIND